MKTITLSDEAATLLSETIASELAALNTRIDLCVGLTAFTEAERCQTKAATLFHIKQLLERA